MNSFRGIHPPIATIFSEDGKVSYRDMQMHADFLIQGGLQGLVYLGTTGEFGSMTVDERAELIRIMVPYIDNRANVIIGVGDTCLKNTLRLVHEAENDGADAVLVLPPYFSVYPDKNIEAYFRRICSESDIPVFIYNFPALTGFSFDVGLVRRLLTDCPNLIGIKDTTDDTEHLRAMISLKKEFPRFVVYSAYEKQAWQMMNEGVDGFVNATANFAPDISSIFFREFSKDNLIMARDYYEMMIKASKIYDCSEPLYLAVKEAVYQRVLGHRGTERLPALSLNVERREEIGEILRELSKMQEPYSMQVQKGI